MPGWQAMQEGMPDGFIGSDVHIAAAVDREDLAGNVRRIHDQELHRARDVFRLADALEQAGTDDALARHLVFRLGVHNKRQLVLTKNSGKSVH